MKKTLIAISMMLGALVGHADLPPNDLEKSYLSSAQNRLFNPGFEQALQGWTASTPSTLTLETDSAQVWNGKGSMKFIATAGGQTVTSRTFNFPSNQAGVTYTISCRYKTTNSDFVMRAIDDSGNDLHSVTSTYNIPASTSYQRWTISFGTPSSGGVRLRFTSASAGTIRSDDCYGGIAEGFNSAVYSQATIYGAVRWPGTTNCSFSLNTPAGFQSYSPDPDCTLPTGSNVFGNASDMTGQSKIPSIYFSYLPEGEYEVTFTGYLRQNAGSTHQCVYQIYDGSTGSGLAMIGGNGDVTGSVVIARFSQLTPGAKTFSLRVATHQGTPVCLVQNTTTPTEDSFWTVKRFPSSREQAFKLDSQPFFGGILTTVSATDSDVSSSSTWENVSSANWATKTLFGSATAGTTSTHLSFKMPYLPAGTYELCSNYTITSTQGIGCYAAMFDGTNRITSFADQNVVSSVQEGRSLSCGAVTYASPQTNLEFSIQMRNNSGTTNCSLEGSLIASTGGYKNFYIKSMGVTVPVPVTPGGVVTRATSTFRVETLKFGGASEPAPCTASPCTILSQSSAWFSTLVRNSIGNYTLNMTGWNSNPFCLFYPYSNGGNVVPRTDAVGSATTFNFITVNLGSANADTGGTILCIGN